MGELLRFAHVEQHIVGAIKFEPIRHGHIPKAINIPLSQLRSRYFELPKSREIWVCCAVGQRAYFATRFLTQHGYRSLNLSGGYTTYGALKAAGLAP